MEMKLNLVFNGIASKNNFVKITRIGRFKNPNIWYQNQIKCSIQNKHKIKLNKN
jgi:hypothetical protein